MVGRDLHVGGVLHAQVNLCRLGLSVSWVLGLAGQIGVVVLLLRGELERGDGRDPLCVFDLLCGLGDALGDDCSGPVQPSYLEDEKKR